MIMRVIGYVTMKKRSSKFDNIRASVKGRPHRRDGVFEVLVFGRQQMSGRTRIAFDWDVVSLPYTPVCKYRGRAGPWRRELRGIVQVSEQHQRNDGGDRTFNYLLTPP